MSDTAIKRVDAASESCPDCNADWEFGCTTGVDHETGYIVISCNYCSFEGQGHMDDIDGRA